ncbi:MAG: class I SAM-dependent DNA methyltransferase [Thermoplasmata archaeon]
MAEKERRDAMTAGPLMFHQLAEYYDSLVAEKDYVGEVECLERLAERFGRSRGRAWLDVACGSGRQLELLRRKHTVVGVDLSAQMLRGARRRLPETRLVRADMRSFRLEGSFDVVSCLFSAVGHLRTERDLQRAFTNFARHLKPGGVAIVEPWIDPEDFRPGYLHLVTGGNSGHSIARMAFSSRRGGRSMIRYHYLVGEPGRGVRHLEETDVGLLVPRKRLVGLMKSAGLETRFVKHGLTSGRGLLIGRKRVRAREAPGGVP